MKQLKLELRIDKGLIKKDETGDYVAYCSSTKKSALYQTDKCEEKNCDYLWKFYIHGEENGLKIKTKYVNIEDVLKGLKT